MTWYQFFCQDEETSKAYVRATQAGWVAALILVSYWDWLQVSVYTSVSQGPGVHRLQCHVRMPEAAKFLLGENSVGLSTINVWNETWRLSTRVYMIFSVDRQGVGWNCVQGISFVIPTECRWPSRNNIFVGYFPWVSEQGLLLKILDSWDFYLRVPRQACMTSINCTLIYCMHSSYSLTLLLQANWLLYFQAWLGALFSHVFGQPVLCQSSSLFNITSVDWCTFCNHLYLSNATTCFKGCRVRTRFLLPRFFSQTYLFLGLENWKSPRLTAAAGPFHLKGAGFGASTLAQCRGFG